MRALAGIVSLLAACTLNTAPKPAPEYVPEIQLFYLREGAVIMPEELGRVIGTDIKAITLGGPVMREMRFDMDGDNRPDAIAYLKDWYPIGFGIDRCSPMYEQYLSIMAGRATISPPQDLSEEILKNKTV